MGRGVMQGNGMRMLAVLAVFGVAACQPGVPNSGAGVGFADYEAFEQSRLNREAALRRGGSVFPAGPIGAAPMPGPVFAGAEPARPVISGDELRAAGIAVPGVPPVSTGPIGAAPLTTASVGAPISAIAPEAPAAVPGATGSPAISDEQDFDAVSGRQTIESDAERLARQRAAYAVVQPTPVPTRPGDSSPNIVSYALSTTNELGQQVHTRSGFNADSRFLRACAGYSSSDKAQEEFLLNGGPQRDRAGVDPDGDGFACYWDPTPFRRAAGN